MNNVQGIDCSSWQDNQSTPQRMDFDKAKAKGAKFVFIKSSQALYIDQDFIFNWDNAKRAGLARGAYHFLVWDVSGSQQAEYQWSLLRSDPGELEIVVDFEWWSTIPLTALTFLRNFLEQMKTHVPASKLVIYTAKSFWDAYGKNDPYWKQYGLWLCDITGPVEVPSPWTTYFFQQYSFGKGQGLAYGAESLDIDLDCFNGDEDAFNRRYGLTIAIPVIPVIPTPTTGLYMKCARFVNIRAKASSLSNDLGDVNIGDRVGPIVGFSIGPANGSFGGFAHLANGTFVCVADISGNVYLVEA